MRQPRAPRIIVKTPVSFEGKSGVGRGTTFNLSLGGCGFESRTELDMNSTIKLELHVPTDMKPVRVARAKVVWAAGSDVGVEFLDMGSTGQIRLQHYLDSLEQNTPKTAKA
jgi:c-di-GMP-binding flagellar brake protein YcgR